MTGMLKQVMHERADELGHSPVDLDAVLRDADRRIRRRRVVAVAAGAASVVAVAALAMQVVPSGGGSTQVTDGSDAVPYAISYASRRDHPRRRVRARRGPPDPRLRADRRGLRLHLHGPVPSTPSSTARPSAWVPSAGSTRTRRNWSRTAREWPGSTSRTASRCSTSGPVRSRTRPSREYRGDGRCAPGHGARRHHGVLRRRPRCGGLGLRDRRGDGPGHHSSLGRGCRGGPPAHEGSGG